MSNVSKLKTKHTERSDSGRAVHQIVSDCESNELVFAVVGPVGAGSSLVAETLKDELELETRGYDVEILKASDEITEWSKKSKFPIDVSSGLKKVESYQSAGDKMREDDDAAVAVRLIKKIREIRAKKINNEETNNALSEGQAVKPDGKKRAYIIDSLKHPAEVTLLRMVYKEAFCLIGVVCAPEVRLHRLQNGKFTDAGLDEIKKFMARDESDLSSNKHGQHVAKTFHLSDFFCDNSCPNMTEQGTTHSDWDIAEKIGRLVDALTHSIIVRPEPHEIGMYNAFSARLRSACLSRQVGAALADRDGNILATGANEVPKAGGGTYGSGYSPLFQRSGTDHRCMHKGQCSNTTTQYEIIDEIIHQIEELNSVADKQNLKERLKKTPIGQLIEYSRAVHAEMDSLLSAARQGSSIVGARMYVTTYPCHNCARHIVAAGVDEVQFIEPYLKSRATTLHGDSITTSEKDWIPPSQMTEAQQNHIFDSDKGADPTPKVLFRPFKGIAPSLFKRVFLKDRDLKNEKSGMLHIGESDRSIRSSALMEAYCEIEARILDKFDGQ